MNNADFEKKLFANPRDDSDEMRQALAADHARQHLQSELLALDDRLRISPPADLQARLNALPHTTAAGSKAQRTLQRYCNWHAVLPMAASLLFAISLGLYFWPLDEEAMRRDILSHVYADLMMLEVDKDIDLSMLNQQMHHYGAHLATSPETRDMDVMDIKGCRVAHEASLHMVLNTPRGPVTVFVMSNQPLDSEYAIHDGRFSGVITPTPKGNLAILGDERSAEGISEVKTMLAGNMVW